MKPSYEGMTSLPFQPSISFKAERVCILNHTLVHDVTLLQCVFTRTKQTFSLLLCNFVCHGNYCNSPADHPHDNKSFNPPHKSDPLHYAERWLFRSFLQSSGISAMVFILTDTVSHIVVFPGRFPLYFTDSVFLALHTRQI